MLCIDTSSLIAYLEGDAGEDVELVDQAFADRVGVIAPDGAVYGIELLNANEQLRAEDQGNLVVINEAVGERREISLAK